MWKEIWSKRQFVRYVCNAMSDVISTHITIPSICELLDYYWRWPCDKILREILILIFNWQSSRLSWVSREDHLFCVLLAQWITWLTRDRCNPKVPSSIPAGGKDFPWARKFNHIALCLGGHIKVRVPGATIARKNTCVIITLQYYAPKWALLSINQNQDQAIRFQLTFLVCESEPFYEQLDQHCCSYMLKWSNSH